MKVWLINNYNMLPEHGHLNRNYYLAKYLKRMGHDPVCFVGSHPHNTNLQLISDKQKFKVFQEKPFPWVLIKTRNYEGSKLKRILSMFEFYFHLFPATKLFEKPDAIIGSSAHPLAAFAAIQLGRRYHCKSIVEIRDLWPESIVAYGIADRNNPLIKLLYRFEKYLYENADELVFTMENALQYLVEQGLDKVIDDKKLHYLNNGVDLEEFNFNKQNYKIDDEDLNNLDSFKVVYTGSIRKVNNIGLLLDVAKRLTDSSIKMIIWGSGDELAFLKDRLYAENISNVVFKGKVDKKYIPYITSKADLNLMHNNPSPVLKYGLSANKLFDYAAAGKPILTDFYSGMNPIEKFNAGVVSDSIPCSIAKTIEWFSKMDKQQYQTYCNNAIYCANEYSYERLASKLVEIIDYK